MFKNIRADIRRDLREEKSLSIAEALRLIRLSEGLQALVVYRFGRWLHAMRKHWLGWPVALPLYPLYWLLSVCVRKAYGIHLAQSADIAAGFYINHFGGIEIKNCRIGAQCSIYQQVKIKPAEGTDTGPVIGNEVFIGAHAQICANIKVGDGASIGPGTVIEQNIPDHCLVLGNPSRIAQRDYSNRGFFAKQHEPYPAGSS